VVFTISHDGIDVPVHTSTGTVTANQWVHIAGTFDGTDVRIYINGQLDTTINDPGVLHQGGLDLTLGGDLTYFLDGYVDEVRLLDTVISAFNPGVVINEVCFDPSSGTEWVELYNGGGTTVDCTDWAFVDGDGNVYQVPAAGANYQVSSGSFVTLWLDDSGPADSGTDWYTANGQTTTLGTNDLGGSGGAGGDLLFIYSDATQSWDNIIGYVSWGNGGALTNADLATESGYWGANDNVSIVRVQQGYSIGLKTDGDDEEGVVEWITYKVHSEGTTNSNGVTIPEFPQTVMPFIFIFLLYFARIRRPGRSKDHGILEVKCGEGKDKRHRSTRKHLISDTYGKASWRSKKAAKGHKIKGLLLVGVYFVYVILVVGANFNIIANETVQQQMDPSYTYHLEFPENGTLTHYYVELADPNFMGIIDLAYFTGTNTVVIQTENIKVLRINSTSVFEDEALKVYKDPPLVLGPDFYKDWFIFREVLYVDVITDVEMTELSFFNVLKPVEVRVDGMMWNEGVDYDILTSPAGIRTSVPVGETEVEIWFIKPPTTPPTAFIQASTTTVGVGVPVTFSSLGSFDPDGLIVSYVWDLGDGDIAQGEEISHSFDVPGFYNVTLLVRDNDDLSDSTNILIEIVAGSPPMINTVVENMVKMENSPPWELDFTSFESDVEDQGDDLRWYFTDVDNSFIEILGQNSTDDRFILTPKKNAFGNNLATLWLEDSTGMRDSQRVWINITPINSAPRIDDIPMIWVTIDEPYTFNFLPYIHDEETEEASLTLSINDPEHVTINGTQVEFSYPSSFENRILTLLLSVTDGIDSTYQVFMVNITKDKVPKVIAKLPDLELEEDTILKDVFDLDDYFDDEDGDAIIFTFGQTHLTIDIKANHSVDVYAESEWYGTEIVTFRALDPHGAHVEDIITITVNPVNDPPAIEPLNRISVHYDYPYIFDFSPYISDVDNTLDELSLTITDMNGDVYPYSTPLLDNHLSIKFVIPELYNGEVLVLNAVVLDGLEMESTPFLVAVTADFPPELINNLPDVVFDEDVTLEKIYDLDDYFYDPDNDIVIYTETGLYVHVDIDQENFATFWAEDDWYGTELVTFRGTDPTGAIIEDTITATVLPVNDGPILIPLPDFYIDIGKTQAIDLRDYVADIDTDFTDLDIDVSGSEYVLRRGFFLIFSYPEYTNPATLDISVSDGEFDEDGQFNVEVTKYEKSSSFLQQYYWLLLLILIAIGMIFALVGRRIILAKKDNDPAIVEEVFCVPPSGDLLGHISFGNKLGVEGWGFAAMFTAIQSFIKSSMENEEENLEQLEFGRFKLHVEWGGSFYLAIIYSGEDLHELTPHVKDVISKIDDEFGKIIPVWDGNIQTTAGISTILEDLDPKRIYGKDFKDKADKKAEMVLADNVKKDIEKLRKKAIIAREKNEPDIYVFDSRQMENDRQYQMDEYDNDLSKDQELEVVEDRIELGAAGYSKEDDHILVQEIISSESGKDSLEGVITVEEAFEDDLTPPLDNEDDVLQPPPDDEDDVLQPPPDDEDDVLQPPPDDEDDALQPPPDDEDDALPPPPDDEDEQSSEDLEETAKTEVQAEPAYREPDKPKRAQLLDYSEEAEIVSLLLGKDKLMAALEAQADPQEDGSGPHLVYGDVPKLEYIDDYIDVNDEENLLGAILEKDTIDETFEDGVEDVTAEEMLTGPSTEAPRKDVAELEKDELTTKEEQSEPHPVEEQMRIANIMLGLARSKGHDIEGEKLWMIKAIKAKNDGKLDYSLEIVNDLIEMLEPMMRG